MKLTKTTLIQLIKEEIENTLLEAPSDEDKQKAAMALGLLDHVIDRQAEGDPAKEMDLRLKYRKAMEELFCMRETGSPVKDKEAKKALKLVMKFIREYGADNPSLRRLERLGKIIRVSTTCPGDPEI